MTMLRLETIPADYRQLIAQIKNLAFWECVSCAIVLRPATVPSSSTAGFDKTCYPSPKGRFIGRPDKPPFFLCRSGHGRSAAHSRRHKGHAPFRAPFLPVESRIIGGLSKRGNAKCAVSQKLHSQPLWRSGLAPVSRPISNAPAWARRSGRARQSFWIPIRSPARWSVRRPARFATTLPTCADIDPRPIRARDMKQATGGARPRPVHLRCVTRACGRGAQ